ncbi:hypothetical protein [Streptomyces sp. NPDC046182]|uniref:hypothetical protein n=1 Tax=Streptomyces sp. NPDC046182 TaxID=3154601 RepID=UPI0033BFBED6
MRPLACSRLTVLAISAALTLGAAGTAVADEHHPSRVSAVTAETPHSEIEALKAKVATAVDAAKGITPASRPLASVDVGTTSAKAAPTDVISDALATVQQAVSGLLAAVTGGVGGLVPQVTTTLTSLINSVLSGVLGGLPALPTLPALPVEVPTLPAELPEVEVPEVELPAVAPPEVELPEVAPPEVALPALPEVALPVLW